MEKDFQKYEYKVNDNKERITGAFWNSMAIEVPEKIDGFEVTEIGDYAFSQPIGDVVKLNFTTSPIEEIILPNSIKKIGRYAFYNCRDLRRIQFYNTLKDIGAGAFTGCHKVREIDVTFVENERSCLRELLMELPEEQTIFYHSKQGEAKLIFPEFFEEAVENTPARILETHTHGSGMMYRNCFVRQELQFHLYDERFEWAKGREYEDTLFRLVFGRLLYPYQLSEKAKKKYISFLKEHIETCIKWAAEEMREKECKFLAEHCISEQKTLEYLIEQVNKKNRVELTSYLMELRRQKFQAKRKIFEL